jgi:polyferredoxin
MVIATILLYRGEMTSGIRLAFLAGGTLIFGFVFGFLIPGSLRPNPVYLLRTLFASVLVRRQLVPPIVVALAFLLGMVFISNKSVCGWACQLGLLQDLVYRIPLPKWKPSFRLSNTVRTVAFGALVAGLVLSGLDWIGVVDPFRLFSFGFTWGIVILSLLVLIVSPFIYRPWCQFLCPFGLIGWLVEQVSLFRPRVNRAVCKACELCVRACPGQAMGDFYRGSKIHADCFACGACIEACSQTESLGWWTRSRVR